MTGGAGDATNEAMGAVWTTIEAYADAKAQAQSCWATCAENDECDCEDHHEEQTRRALLAVIPRDAACLNSDQAGAIRRLVAATTHVAGVLEKDWDDRHVTDNVLAQMLDAALADPDLPAWARGEDVP